MVEAMKKGDWKAAQQELQQLKKQLADGKLDAQAKKELQQQQLKQIQDKLNEAKEARQQAMEDLKKQIERTEATRQFVEGGRVAAEA